MQKMLKKIMLVMMVLMLSITCITSTVHADVEEFTKLIIKADVSDYDGDIIFIFTQDNGFKYEAILTKNENYTETLDIVGDLEYTPEVVIKNNPEDYTVLGLEKKYKVDSKKFEVNFKIKKGLQPIQETETTEPKKVDLTEKDDLTNKNNLSKKEIYDYYMDSVSYIKDNEDYTRFLNQYNNDLMKSYFMDADSSNTEDDWNNMDNFQKFNYYILFVRTQSLIMGPNSVESEEKLLKELSSENIVLGNIKDGYKVVEAVKTVWRWEWHNWETTGKFTNLFKDSDEKKSSEKKDIVSEDDKEENKSSNTALIVVVAVIVIGTIGVVVAMKKNKR